MAKKVEVWEDERGHFHRSEREALLTDAAEAVRDFAEAGFDEDRGKINTHDIGEFLIAEAEPLVPLLLALLAARVNCDDARAVQLRVALGSVLGKAPIATDDGQVGVGWVHDLEMRVEHFGSALRVHGAREEDRDDYGTLHANLCGLVKALERTFGFVGPRNSKGGV